jgi:phage-related protein
MARQTRPPEEKQVLWVGGAKQELMRFPEVVRHAMGVAIGVAQYGGKHPAAKPWKGEGPGVLEVVEASQGNAYRAVYTVRLEDAVYVLYAFQKKSRTGIKTDARDVENVSRRLKLAQADYEARHGKQKH